MKPDRKKSKRYELEMKIKELLQEKDAVKEIVLFKTGNIGIFGVHSHYPISMGREKWNVMMALIPKIQSFLDRNNSEITEAEAEEWRPSSEDKKLRRPIPVILAEEL